MLTGLLNRLGIESTSDITEEHFDEMTQYFNSLNKPDEIRAVMKGSVNFHQMMNGALSFLKEIFNKQWESDARDTDFIKERIQSLEEILKQGDLSESQKDQIIDLIAETQKVINKVYAERSQTSDDLKKTFTRYGGAVIFVFAGTVSLIALKKNGVIKKIDLNKIFG